MATATKKPTSKTNNSDSKKVKDLETQVAKLTEMLQLLTNVNINNSNSNNMIDRDVTFISLCNNILNLSTEPNGQGVIYTFNEFGEEQVIPYSDARLVIRNNKSFIKEGKCFIADKELVNAEKLSKDYEKLLNKDDLIDLMTKSRDAFNKIFDNMTKSQKEIFKDILSKKIMEDKNSVDMNIVQRVNEVFNIDILKDIEFGKSLLTEKN